MPIESRRIMISPVGKLLLCARHNDLIGLILLADVNDATTTTAVRQVQPVENDSPVLAQASEQLEQYFAGRRREFHLPFSLEGLPSFTGKILETLLSVPFGTTVTYGELAAKAGCPRAARAVGRVMAANPLPIVIPCHRVVAAGGHPGGYSGGGGLRTKEWLLTFERNVRLGN